MDLLQQISHHHHHKHHHKHDAKQIIEFLHNLPRFFNGTHDFDLLSSKYIYSLQFTALSGFLVGSILFSILFTYLIRRLYFKKRNGMVPENGYIMNVPIVIFLGMTTITALFGLVALAEVDYTVSLTSHAGKNISHRISSLNHIDLNLSHSSKRIQRHTNDMIDAYDIQHLPKDALKLIRLTNSLHYSIKNISQLIHLLPQDLETKSDYVEQNFFWIKGADNLAALLITIMTFTAILAIIWQIGSSVKAALIWLIFLLPICAALSSLFLMGSMATADFCIDPARNSLQLFGNAQQQSMISYYTTCSKNVTSPFEKPMANISDTLDSINNSLKQFQEFVNQHPDDFPEIEERFLIPLRKTIQSADQTIVDFNSTSTCKSSHDDISLVTKTWCTFGVVGQYYLWLNHLSLCFFLFISVIALFVVWEIIESKTLSDELQYQLLATYEEDNLEHVYLSAD